MSVCVCVCHMMHHITRCMCVCLTSSVLSLTRIYFILLSKFINPLFFSLPLFLISIVLVINLFVLRLSVCNAAPVLEQKIQIVCLFMFVYCSSLSSSTW